MYLTVAADCILAPFEGLQLTARNSNALRLAWASLKDSKPLDLSKTPHCAVLSNRSFAPDKCQITDDSVLAFAVKSAVSEILSKDLSQAEQRAVFEQSFLDFALRYRDVVNGFGAGFESWLKNPKEVPKSNGNGVLMRMQAILDLPIDNPHRERLSILHAGITHGPEAVQMARAFESAHRRTAALNTLAEREDFLVYCAEKLLVSPKLNSTNWTASRGQKWFISSARETLGLACLIAAHSLSWDDLFDLVAWLGGDTDTLAVVSSQLARLTLGEFPQAKLVATTALKTFPELLAICE